MGRQREALRSFWQAEQTLQNAERQTAEWRRAEEAAAHLEADIARAESDRLWEEAQGIQASTVQQMERVGLGGGILTKGDPSHSSLPPFPHEPVIPEVPSEPFVSTASDITTVLETGAALLDQERYEEARQCFEGLVKTTPQDPRSWAGLGAALEGCGEHEEAIRCCTKALEIDPALIPARRTLGAAYYATGRYEELASVAGATLRLAPEDTKTRLMLSEALALSGKLAEAESQAEEALRRLGQVHHAQPEDVGLAHQQLGIISAMRGKKDKAKKQFVKAVQANEKDQWGYKLLDAHLILDAVGTMSSAKPLETRARLLALAQQRTKEYVSWQHWQAENEM